MIISTLYTPHLSIFSLVCFLGIFSSNTVTGQNSGDPRIMDRPERIDIQVVRQKRTRTEGGDYDDKRDRITMIIKVKNRNYNKEFPKMTARFLLIGESVTARNSYVVLDEEEFDFNLGVGNKGGEIEHETQQVVTDYDDELYAHHGNRYEGWIIFLTNSEGQVCAWKASKQVWERNLDRALDLREDQWVDRNLKKIASPEF